MANYDEFLVDSVTSGADNISANSGKTYTITVAKTGYTALGFLGIDHNGDTKLLVGKHSLFTSAYVSVYNMGSSQQSSIKITVTILYRKNKT